MREYVVNRPDEAAMRRALEAEPASPEGVILRLAWQQGLSREWERPCNAFESVLHSEGQTALRQAGR